MQYKVHRLRIPASQPHPSRSLVEHVVLQQVVQPMPKLPDREPDHVVPVALDRLDEEPAGALKRGDRVFELSARRGPQIQPDDCAEGVRTWMANPPARSIPSPCSTYAFNSASYRDKGANHVPPQLTLSPDERNTDEGTHSVFSEMRDCRDRDGPIRHGLDPRQRFPTPHLLREKKKEGVL